MSEKLAGWGLKVGRFALKSWQVETESWQVGGPPLDSKIYRNPATTTTTTTHPLNLALRARI